MTSGEKVYSSNQAFDVNNIKVDELSLAYDFPLAVNKTWCPMRTDPKDPAQKPIPNCQYSGEREVAMQTSFESSAGKFNQCYGMIDRFNDGSILQTFCVGVGIVAMKFDHSGTPFGFEQTLSGYASGTP